MAKDTDSVISDNSNSSLNKYKKRDSRNRFFSPKAVNGPPQLTREEIQAKKDETAMIKAFYKEFSRIVKENL